MNRLLIWAATLILSLTTVAGSEPRADDLYRRFAEACPGTVRVTSFKVTYHGEVLTESGRYHLLGYAYSWEVLPGNERGNGQLLVFDADLTFLGSYAVFGSPQVTITGTRVGLFLPDETAQNQRTDYEFSKGLPATDSRGLGFEFVSADQLKAQQAAIRD